MSNAAFLSASRPSQSGGPLHLALQAYRYLLARFERARVTEHLSSLDDRLLADMGFARADLAKLFR